MRIIDMRSQCFKGDFCVDLDFSNLIVQRFRSKAFSSVCLSHFADSLVLPDHDLNSERTGAG